MQTYNLRKTNSKPVLKRERKGGRDERKTEREFLIQLNETKEAR